MISTLTQTTESKARRIVGRILLYPFFAFMTMDAAIHLARPAFAVEATKKAGVDPSLLLFIGIWEVVALALILFPRFRVLGAVMLTAFFGGAVATHLLSHTPTPVMAVIFAIVMWAAVVLLQPNVGRTLGLEKDLA